jgi:hypothetical protein
MVDQFKLNPSSTYNPNIYNQLSQTMNINNNTNYNPNNPSTMGMSIDEIGYYSSLNNIPYEQMHKNRNVFDHSVSSLGDIYHKVIKKDNRKVIESQFSDVIIENPLFYQMNEYENMYGDNPEYENAINETLLSKSQSNFIRPKSANNINKVILSPHEIPEAGCSVGFRTNKQALYHKPEYKESKKYSHIANGKINPPQSSFSIKQQVEESKDNHNKEMGKFILTAKKITIKHNEPEPILPGKLRRKVEESKSNINVFNPKESMMIIGEGFKSKHNHIDNHVIYRRPKENKYERKSVSSRKARKTLMVSEKLFGAVDDFFTSNEMKIPSKNQINDIVKYSQDMEKSLNSFNTDLMKSQTKSNTMNERYEDPFRKSLQSKKGLIKPKAKKIYPEIDDNYKRTVMEKMSRLQIELRQIFDNITQIKETSGDEIKINEMINKAKELTGLITHLAKDIKHKEEEFKNKKKIKKSVSPKKINDVSNTTTTTNKVSSGGLNTSNSNSSSKLITNKNNTTKQVQPTKQQQQQRPISATNKQVSNINIKQTASKTSPTFPIYKDNNNNNKVNSNNTTNTNMTMTTIPKPIDQKATYESIQKSTNFLRSTGFNPIIEESQDLRGSNNIQPNTNYINNNNNTSSTFKNTSLIYNNNPPTFNNNTFQQSTQFHSSQYTPSYYK